MALAFFGQVCGVAALVFAEPALYGDYDFYVKCMPDGWLRRLLSQQGRQWYDALTFLTNFCMAFSIAICIDAYSGQVRGAITDCLAALFLLIIALRYAHTRIFRTWHTHGRAGIVVAVLLVLLQLLICICAAVVAFVLVSSASLAAWACIPMLVVIVAFAINFAAACYVLHTVRTNAHQYSNVASSVSSGGASSTATIDPEPDIFTSRND